jgi:topoisomerase-4 subunit A
MVSTDYRPVLEVIFSKRSLNPIQVNAEEFIDIKGVNALGNLLTKDKVKQVNALEPLPYEIPDIENIEVEMDEIESEIIEEDTIEKSSENKDDDLPEPPIENGGQTLLF